jgi:hypothetical protein
MTHRATPSRQEEAELEAAKLRDTHHEATAATHLLQDERRRRQTLTQENAELQVRDKR